MQKFLENLLEAKKIIHTADHMLYVTLPLVKDKKILLKIVLETKKAIVKSMNAILQYEYILKRISLYKNPKSNFKTFMEKCSKRYKISREDLQTILELFDITEKSKQSSMEIFKEDKIIILSENLQPKTLKIEDAKKFLSLSKKIVQNFEIALKTKM